MTEDFGSLNLSTDEVTYTYKVKPIDCHLIRLNHVCICGETMYVFVLCIMHIIRRIW